MRRNNVGLGPELFLRIINEVAEVNVREVQLGHPGSINEQSHSASGQRFADVVGVTLVAQLTVVAEGRE